VLAERLEYLANEALGRPVRHANHATRPADAEKLARGLCLVGRKHDAESRYHRIEAVIFEWQLLRIGDPERNILAFSLGARPTASEERIDVVGRRDVTIRDVARGRLSRCVSVNPAGLTRLPSYRVKFGLGRRWTICVLSWRRGTRLSWWPMKQQPAFTIADVMSSDRLLGPYFHGESWNQWAAVLKATRGRSLTNSRPRNMLSLSEAA
jgi:hypothetical protein